MAALLTTILCILLCNCTKRIKQEFLDTDSVQLKTFAYYFWQMFPNYWLLGVKKSYTEDRRTPKSAGPVAIATFATIVNPALGAVCYRVTDQQEKVVILCISLTTQCHKHCYIIFQGSWQPEISILSMLLPSASVSKIVLKTCAALWKVLQPVPNQAMWEKYSTISAFSHCVGSVRMGSTWLCKHRLAQNLLILIRKRHTVLFC